MENLSAAKSKNKFLKLLPKAASAVTFQKPHLSPKKDKKFDYAAKLIKTRLGKGFTRGGFSLIPADARRKSKNSIFETQEPSSPKVSCMGQIKHKKKIKKDKHVSLPKDFNTESSSYDAKKKKSTIRNLFSGARRRDRRPAASAGMPPVPERGPSLGQIKRFASGRNSLASFDWTAQVAPGGDGDHRDYYSDEESEGEEEREIRIPFSAPILVGGGGGEKVVLEPKKEINLWKRRTMAPPRPLQVNTLP